MKLFYLLLVGHFLGDYVCYIRRLSESKRSGSLDMMLGSNFAHAGIHLVWTWLILSAVYEDLRWVIPGFLVFEFHLLVDFFRCVLEVKVFKVGKGIGLRQVVKAILARDFGTVWDNRYSIMRGIVDQIVHVGSLYLITLMV